MPRKHLFPLVVLLGAAVVAGLLALTRTVHLGQTANASNEPDQAISFRLKRLDSLESSLRKQLKAANSAAAPAPVPQTIYRRAPATVAAPTAHGDDGGAEHEGDGERDD